MKLERALLGPASGNRDYGLLGTTPDLRLLPRQRATLAELIFGARSTISTTDQSVVFFPLAGRDGDLWALARIAPETFESGLRVFADALVLTRAQLDAIGWAAHRLLEQHWGARRASELETLSFDEKRLWEGGSHTSRENDILLDARISEAGGQVWLACKGVEPTAALITTLDALLPETRAGLTYSSAPTLRWSPPEASTAAFDITVGDERATPAQPAITIPFERSGPQIERSREQPWDRGLYEFRRARPLGWRRVDRRAGPAPATHEAAFSALLDRYTAENAFGLLADAVKLGSRLHRERKLDSAGYRGLSAALSSRFEREVGDLDAASAARALDEFDAEIAPHLAEARPDMAARIAINSKALGFLNERAIAAIAPQLFGNSAFLRKAAVLLQTGGGLQEGYAAWASAVERRLERNATAEIVDFASALWQAALRHPKPAGDDVLRLTLSLIQLGKSRVLVDEARRWGTEFQSQKMSADELKQRLNALSKPLVQAKGTGTFNLSDSRLLGVWLAIDEAAAHLDAPVKPPPHGGGNAVSTLWGGKSRQR
jgi:hypothetical protein